MQWFSLSLSKKGFCKVWLCTVKITANLPHACTLQIMQVLFSKSCLLYYFQDKIKITSSNTQDLPSFNTGSTQQDLTTMVYMWFFDKRKACHSQVSLSKTPGS